MNLLIDRAALGQIRFLRLARGRVYYLAEPPILGIVVVRFDARLEEIAGLVIDANLGYEPGVEGWCEPGYSGHKHGKATLYRVVEGAAVATLSQVLGVWRERYPMR